jgi:hypothetical protein
MNPELIPKLIAEIALADPRIRRDDPTERRAQAKMWAGILANVPYEAALQFALQHYRVSQWPILPADIATRWSAESRARLGRHTDPTPAIDPDRVTEWCAELGAARRAVADGHAAPAPYAIAEGPPVAVAELVSGIGHIPPTRDTETPYMSDHMRNELAPFRRPHRPEWAITCPVPTCRAIPGQRCTRPSGGPIAGGSHPSRLDDWLTQQAAA